MQGARFIGLIIKIQFTDTISEVLYNTFVTFKLDLEEPDFENAFFFNKSLDSRTGTDEY